MTRADKLLLLLLCGACMLAGCPEIRTAERPETAECPKPRSAPKPRNPPQTRRIPRARTGTPGRRAFRLPDVPEALRDPADRADLSGPALLGLFRLRRYGPAFVSGDHRAGFRRFSERAAPCPRGGRGGRYALFAGGRAERRRSIVSSGWATSIFTNPTPRCATRSFTSWCCGR